MYPYGSALPFLENEYAVRTRYQEPKRLYDFILT